MFFQFVAVNWQAKEFSCNYFFLLFYYCAELLVNSVIFFTEATGSSPIDQGSANIFCKGPNSKYFRLCGPRGKLDDIYVGRPT
jgi:hypothetical protein